MTLIIMPKFNYEEMLKSIVRYKVTHLLYDLFSTLLYLILTLIYHFLCSIVPPQVVLFCKVIKLFSSSISQLDHSPLASNDKEVWSLLLALRYGWGCPTVAWINPPIPKCPTASRDWTRIRHDRNFHNRDYGMSRYTLNSTLTEGSQRHPYPNEWVPLEAWVTYFLAFAPRWSKAMARWLDIMSRVNWLSLARKWLLDIWIIPRREYIKSQSQLDQDWNHAMGRTKETFVDGYQRSWLYNHSMHDVFIPQMDPHWRWGTFQGEWRCVYRRSPQGLATHLSSLFGASSIWSLLVGRKYLRFGDSRWPQLSSRVISWTIPMSAMQVSLVFLTNSVANCQWHSLLSTPMRPRGSRQILGKPSESERLWLR